MTNPEWVLWRTLRWSGLECPGGEAEGWAVFSMERRWPWGDLTAAPMTRSSERQNQAFPSGVWWEDISLTLNRKRFFPYEDGQAVEQIAQLHRAFSSLELFMTQTDQTEPCYRIPQLTLFREGSFNRGLLGSHLSSTSVEPMKLACWWWILHLCEPSGRMDRWEYPSFSTFSTCSNQYEPDVLPAQSSNNSEGGYYMVIFCLLKRRRLMILSGICMNIQ